MASTSLYSIQIQLTDTTPVFNGYFEVDDTTHVIQHFYDTSNLSVDILGAPGGVNGGDNTYESGWASFSYQGCNITSFPYFFGNNSFALDLYGTTTTSSNIGRLYGTICVSSKDLSDDLVFQFTSIGSAPTTPTSPITPPTVLYSISITQPTLSKSIFNGYFEVNSTSNYILGFYDTSTSGTIGTNIIYYGANNVAPYDNTYQSGWLGFNAYGAGGVAVTSIPAFNGIITSSYTDLLGNTSTDDVATIMDSVTTSSYSFVYTIASIVSIPSPTGAIDVNQLYSIQLQLRNTAPIFNGYFETNIITNVIQHFYDTSDISTDILSSGTFDNPDNIYHPEWLCLSNTGTNLISFTAIGASSTDFNVAGQPGANPEGSVDIGAIVYNDGANYVNILFVISSIGSIPASTDPIPATVLYSCQIKTLSDYTILNAYFESNLISGLIQHFYDTSNISTDILTTPTYFTSADNVYQGPGWLSFSNNGVVISTFPFLGASDSEFKLYNYLNGDGSTNNNVVMWNSGASTQLGTVSFQYITSIPSPTDPIVLPTLYSIQLTAGSTVIFRGYFEINESNVIQHFYDTSDSTTIVTDILSSGSWSSPDNLYQYGWGSFSTNGVNITSFPYYSLVSTGDWHITGSGDANTAGFVTAQSGSIMPRLAAAAPVTFSVGPISAPPSPTGPITPYSPPSPPSGVVCFKEGSKILTNTGYKPIQDLRKGDLVQTSKNGYKAIFMIGKRDIEHIGSEERIKDQLYSCKQEQYPELLEELVITGCHSILVDSFKEGEQERTRDVNGKIYVTDNKYRLPACVDMRASVYEKKGVHTIYHIALENDDYFMNYGVYANGLLVETCSKRYLKELSNMTLIE